MFVSPQIAWIRGNKQILTITILLIALVHGIPVALAGVFTKGRGIVTVVAALMAIVAVMSGSSRFTVVDLIAICGAYWWSLSRTGPSKQHAAPTVVVRASTAQPFPEKSNNQFGGWWAYTIILGACWWYFVYSPSRAVQTELPVAQQTTKATSPMAEAAQKSYAEGVSAYKKGDAVKAVREFSLAAQYGHASAQGILGSLYLQGEGGLKKDDVEAVRLFQLAANQRYAAGQSALGFMYESGRGGLAKDGIEAERLYRLAAINGDALGQSNLGAMYENGLGGLNKDVKAAISWYRKAAQQSDPHGIASLRRLRVPLIAAPSGVPTPTAVVSAQRNTVVATPSTFLRQGAGPQISEESKNLAWCGSVYAYYAHVMQLVNNEGAAKNLLFRSSRAITANLFLNLRNGMVSGEITRQFTEVTSGLTKKFDTNQEKWMSEISGCDASTPDVITRIRASRTIWDGKTFDQFQDGIFTASRKQLGIH